MTDREKKIAEIRKFRKKVQLHGWSWCPKQYDLYYHIEFLLSELDRLQRYQSIIIDDDRGTIQFLGGPEHFIVPNKLDISLGEYFDDQMPDWLKQLCEENQKLREERDEWIRQYKRLEQTSVAAVQSAQQESERLRKQLTAARDMRFTALSEREQKLIEGLRRTLIGAKHESCKHESQDPTWHCCDWSELVGYLEEIGVTE